MGLGALIQVLKSENGFPVLREYAEGFLAFPASVVRHFDFSKAPIGDVRHAGGIPWSTPALSPALAGIGFIIGPRYACITVSGGILAWWVLIPLLLFFDPDFAARIENAPSGVAAYTLWYNVVRPVAVGMMLVGAANTMFSMRGSIVASLRVALAASRAGAAHSADPTERDIPVRWTLAAIAVLFLPVAAIYYSFTGSVAIALAT
ncbi:MAG: OPT/YSL family transporter, partial [Bryobacteraceae bacterium]|nr:OPT/YSL family transporter [Bryobacteraceae bacterium]